MNEYAIRDAIIQRMGFRSYAEYLNSDLWKSIRRRAMKKACRRCAVCKNDAFEVHHNSYAESVLVGFDISKLTCLCRTCHDLIEFDSNGNKRSLTMANTALATMQKTEIADRKTDSEIERGRRRLIELKHSAKLHQRRLAYEEKERRMAARRLVKKKTHSPSRKAKRANRVTPCEQSVATG